MKHTQKIFFHLCMLLAVAAMISGHALIMNAGLWFIPGKETYNLHTRWVSDFAAVWPLGLLIKGSIVLFCIALLIFKRARMRSCGEGATGHARWFWNALLTFGLVSGLLLVVLYDMSPPQFTQKDPSWLGKIFGDPPVVVEIPRDSSEYIKRWHHQIGFQMFIVSFALTLFTAGAEKFFNKSSMAGRVDVVYLVFTLLFMLWLFAFHNSLPGIPQRALLVLIFSWVWREGATLLRSRNTASLPGISQGPERQGGG
jgi:hypothetical protein